MLINEKKQVLVSDEYIRGGYYTKFCGGGLEKGEGTIHCLKREFLEEMNLKIEVTSHLYTTDFYQQSAFNPAQQIISIYYYVKALEEIKVPLRSQPFQFDEEQLNIYKEKGLEFANHKLGTIGAKDNWRKKSILIVKHLLWTVTRHVP